MMAGASGNPFDVIALDADDTLWHSEDTFVAVQQRFVDLVSPHVPSGVDLADSLHATEVANLPVLGYGVKAFVLSMVECALVASGERVPAAVVRELINIAHEMLTEPVRVIEGVPGVLEILHGDYRLVVITKGDLVHQQRKMATSGLAHHFEHVEIVSEKDPATYRHLVELLGVTPERFCMVGNSVRSDVLPVLEIGAHAVLVPYTYTWGHEHAEHDGRVAELSSISDLPRYLESAAPAAAS